MTDSIIPSAAAGTTFPSNLNTSPDTGDARLSRYILSSRGMFQRVQLPVPDDFEEAYEGNQMKARLYGIDELDDFFSAREDILQYRLFFLQTVDKTHRDLVTPQIFLDNEKRIFAMGTDYINVIIRGEVFLGPTPVTSNAFVQLIEEFFQANRVYTKRGPVKLREDGVHLDLYLTGLQSEHVDLELGIVGFTLSGVIEKQETFGDFSDLYLSGVVPDCSKDREAFRNQWALPSDTPLRQKVMENLGVESGDPFEASRVALEAKLNFLADVGNVGTTAAAAYNYAAADYTHAADSLSEASTGLPGLAGGLKNVFEGMGFVGNTFLSPIVNIAGGHVEHKVTSSINKRVDNVVGKVVGGRTENLGNKIVTFAGNRAGGVVKQAFGDFVYGALWGSKPYDVVNSPRVNQRLLAVKSTGLYADALSWYDSRWIVDYYKAEIDPTSCQGLGPTSAKPISFPPQETRSAITPGQAQSHKQGGGFFREMGARIGAVISTTVGKIFTATGGIVKSGIQRVKKEDDEQSAAVADAALSADSKLAAELSKPPATIPAFSSIPLPYPGIDFGVTNSGEFYNNLPDNASATLEALGIGDIPNG